MLRSEPVATDVEPFAADGGPVGVLLCHGFTGSPASLRPWAQALADVGYTVRLPRLPGHGATVHAANRTGWLDWYDRVERAYVRLWQRCDHVFVFGLSMGGALALRLAQLHNGTRPAASGAGPVAGLVLVNPAVVVTDRRLIVLPVLRWVAESSPGIGNDIALAGENELGYDRVPNQALFSMLDLMKTVRADLAAVTAPLLLFRSVHDHVVGPESAALILDGVRASSVRERLLTRSFHVATLDYEASEIIEASIDFLQTQVSLGHTAVPTAAGGGPR